METKIKSGSYIVVTYGTIISFSDNPIEIKFKGLDEDELILVFEFVTDSTNSEVRIDPSINNNEKKLILKLINFNTGGISGIDQGNITPMKIGESTNKPSDIKNLFLNFRVRRIGESRTLDYTIYRNE